jgi:hypothetical protein
MARRVVTANNAEGRSYFASDEEVEGMDLWDSLPGLPLGPNPDGSPILTLPTTAPAIDPPPGGSRVVKVAIQPWTIMKPIVEAGIPGLDSRGFHRTATIDYIMIISGEVTLELDEGETKLHAGDLVVQRNTNHAWFNYDDMPAHFWGVVVSMEPIRG